MNAVTLTPASSLLPTSDLDGLALKSFQTEQTQPMGAPPGHVTARLSAADAVASPREPDTQVEQGAACYDLLPIGYVVVEPSGQIVTGNLAFARWLGAERGALRGEMIQRFLPPFEAGRFAAHLEICLGARDTVTLETTLKVPSERVVPVLFTSHAQILDDKTWVHIAITDLAPVRQARRDTCELERDHALLVEALSHDVRAPLVSIREFARLLLDDCADTLRADVKETIQRIERSGRRVQATLQELLAYVGLRREEPRLERVETEQLVLGVVAECREAAARRLAEISIVRPMPAVRACPGLLAEALGNLLANALDFTPAERPPQIMVSCEERDCVVVIKVADHGAGIDLQNRERIFQPGERLLTPPGGPGAGFGLAIVRRAVERMQGRVWVESELGCGSCFHILLPRA